jgi:predicted PurR-regulated permease PerM
VAIQDPIAPGSERPSQSPSRVERADGSDGGRVVVVFHPRSVLTALGVLVGVVAAIEFALLAKAALTLIMVALFLALALNPAVEALQRRGLRRGAAVAVVYVAALVVLALLGLVFIPPLVAQVSKFFTAAPTLLDQLTKGHGPLGILERKYHVVEHARTLTSGSGGGGGGLMGSAGSAFAAVEGVAATVLGGVVIAFLTFFMLLEGPDWRTRVTSLIPDQHRGSVERVGAGVYRSVGGFVTGNLLASLLAGFVVTMIMLIAGVPYAVPIGLFVVVIELVPYVGPIVATLVVGCVALTEGATPALISVGLLLVYHMIEGHTLRPWLYGRAVQLSPLAVLVAILLGTEIAGILGALVAIPVAGSIQVLISEIMRAGSDRRRARVLS